MEDSYKTAARIVAEITDDCIRKERAQLLSLMVRVGTERLEDGVSRKQACGWALIGAITSWMRQIAVQLLVQEGMIPIEYTTSEDAQEKSDLIEDKFAKRADIWVNQFRSSQPSLMMHDKKAIERIAQDVVPLLFTREQAQQLQQVYNTAIRSLILLKMLGFLSSN